MLALGMGVMILMSIACDARSQRQWQQSDNWVAALLDPLMPPTPGEAARDLFDIYDPDLRRRSIALLSASPFGGEAAYVRAYRLLIDDPDPTVRGAAAMALGMHGDVADVPALLNWSEDENDFVRWQVGLALTKIHSRQAVDKLLIMLEDDSDPDARAAAAYALGQYPQPIVFDALVGALNDVDFQVIDNASRSLFLLTGTFHGTRARDWLDWADQNRGALFANQQLYTYDPYWPPKGMFAWLEFWKDYSRPSPRVPIGLDVPGNEGRRSSSTTQTPTEPDPS